MNYRDALRTYFENNVVRTHEILSSPDGSLKVEYDADGMYLNDAGHAILYNRLITSVYGIIGHYAFNFGFDIADPVNVPLWQNVNPVITAPLATPNSIITYDQLGTSGKTIELISGDIGSKWGFSGDGDFAGTGGFTTGNNSGAFNDDVLLDYFFLENSSAILRIKDNDPNKVFSLEIIGSKESAEGAQTSYTINGETQSLNAANNTQEVVHFSNIIPDASGNIDISVSSLENIGYINGLKLTESGSDSYSKTLNSLIAEHFDSDFVGVETTEDLGGTITSSVGQPVRLWKDRLAGNHLRYKGLEDRQGQDIAGLNEANGPPELQIDGSVFFPNTWRNQYGSANLPGVDRTGPFEEWLVVRVHRTRTNESIKAPGSFTGSSLRLVGLNHAEINGGDSGPSAEYPNGVGIPPYLEKLVIRIKADGANSQLYFNQIGQGTVNITSNRIRNLGIGSNGHGQNVRLYRFLYKDGVLTDDEADEIFQAMKFEDPEIGRLPDLPVAIPTEENGGAESTIITKWDNSNKEWFLEFDIHNPLNLPVNQEIQWYYGDKSLGATRAPGGGFLDAQYKLEGAIDPRLNRADYSVGNNLGNPEIFNADGTANPNFFVCAAIKLSEYGWIQTNWLIDNID